MLTGEAPKLLTEQTQQLLEQAKAEAAARGTPELGVDSLVTVVTRHGEARVLLAKALNLGEVARPPEFPRGRSMPLMEKIPLSREVQEVLAAARTLATQMPDLLHPGLVAVRHLACAVAMSRPACELLQASPISEKTALEQLTAWYEGDAEMPELSALGSRLRLLRAQLLRKVFGQDHAVQAFVEALFNAEVVAHADVERKRPRAVFVFAGPPGVGKTYLAELGAEALRRPFKRFDMTEFSDHQAHQQLVGFPPSYQAAQAGSLTGFVAENPTAFLLFDEIEKAHPNTVNLFLQVLDAGRLEDKFTGKTVSFRDTVMIFTTNAGASLYDRPNETGASAANAAFHRRTILDALRTEKNPTTGQPAFPPALCSRLATGYPVLFNHLGINELERIARTELQRVAVLVEQQYYKVITFDDMLPLALVLREGGLTDARTVRGQSETFIKTELFKFSELYTKRRLQRVLEGVDALHFGLDAAAPADAETASIFQPPGKLAVLLVASPTFGDLVQRHIPEVEWRVASTTVEALQILATTEVDLALLDIWLGQSPQTAQTLSMGTVRMFDFIPAGAQALAEGQECLHRIHERLPNLPAYLLSFVEAGTEGTVDEVLLLACMRSGGARGVVPTEFVNDTAPDWQERRQRFMQALQDIALRMYREKKVRALAQQRKALAFDTVPTVDVGQRRVTVRLRNLHLARAVAAEDASELLDDVERPNVRFADVFGADPAKEALQFVVDWLHDPKRYAALGVRPPKGILLLGPPGTGKTMLARALAGESDVAFLVASATDFVTIWQGSGPQNIRDLFARARRYAPSILFIDELDAIGRKRSGAVGAGRAEESTLNALLTEMDGFGAPTLRPVIVLAATNLAELLDDALRRRFDREIEVPPPDKAARLAYLRHEFSGRQQVEVSDATLESIAGRSAGMTISDLRRVTNEAAVMAARRGELLTDAILEEAFEKLRMGEASKVPDAATLARIARHEGGHALVGWFTGNPPVQVTVVGRGSAGGYVEREAQEEKIIYTRAELEQLICQAMGGRAAELLYYGDAEGLSTGVASDLRNATWWATRMIREFGMSDAIGQVFLDPESAREGEVAVQVNQAAERIVRTQLECARQLLETHRDALDRLAAELLDKNRLARPDLERILGPLP